MVKIPAARARLPMKHSITCTWAGDMAFDAEVDGHRLRMDTAPDAGGHDSGPRPKPLLLAAAACCTGMDVASLLKKMRVGIAGFDMVVEGDVSETALADATVARPWKICQGFRIEKAAAGAGGAKIWSVLAPAWRLQTPPHCAAPRVVKAHCSSLTENIP